MEQIRTGRGFSSEEEKHKCQAILRLLTKGKIGRVFLLWVFPTSHILHPVRLPSLLPLPSFVSFLHNMQFSLPSCFPDFSHLLFVSFLAFTAFCTSLLLHQVSLSERFLPGCSATTHSSFFSRCCCVAITPAPPSVVLIPSTLFL